MFLIHMLIANLKNGNPLPICYINETFHKNKDAKNSNLYFETFLEKYTYINVCIYTNNTLMYVCIAQRQHRNPEYKL